jgi:hypothetical protein
VKVLGFVIIVIALVMIYVGITGSQHQLMATLKGTTNVVKSGKSINPSGTAPDNSNTSSTSNPYPATAV